MTTLSTPLADGTPNSIHPVKSRRTIRLSELAEGQGARVVRVGLLDQGCRRRFAELGLGPGAKVSVASAGESVMVLVGTARLGVGRRCAEEVWVLPDKT